MVRGVGVVPGVARISITLLLIPAILQGCGETVREPGSDTGTDQGRVEAEVEAAVWRFHAADTARDAESVVALLWPEFEMLVDGQWLDYGDVAEDVRDFMAGLEAFHTVWSDLRIIPLGPDAALSSFLFRDSIVTRSGELIESRGPTTLLWERREGEWRLRFGDADHYPVQR